MRVAESRRLARRHRPQLEQGGCSSPTGRLAGVDHHLHGLRLELRAESPTMLWHRTDPLSRESPSKMPPADPQAQYPSHPAQKRTAPAGRLGQRRRKGLQYRDDPMLLPGLSQRYGASGRVRPWPPWLTHPCRRRPVAAPPAEAAEAAAAQAAGTHAADLVDGPPFRHGAVNAIKTGFAMITRARLRPRQPALDRSDNLPSPRPARAWPVSRRPRRAVRRGTPRCRPNRDSTPADRIGNGGRLSRRR